MRPKQNLPGYNPMIHFYRGTTDRSGPNAYVERFTQKNKLSGCSVFVAKNILSGELFFLYQNGLPGLIHASFLLCLEEAILIQSLYLLKCSLL